jgi:signal transduction histidine kinase
VVPRRVALRRVAAEGFCRSGFLRVAARLVISIASLFSVFVCVADAQEQARRILALYPYSNLFPTGIAVGEAARRRLNERVGDALELYTDFLDLGRFSGKAYEQRTAQALAEKYHDRKPEIVMALGPQALQFSLSNRQILGFDVPIVFCCTSRARLSALSIPKDVTGIISEFDYTKTLALAQRLQPDSRQIVIVAGASAFDRQSADNARRQLEAHDKKYDIQYFVGLPHEELLEKLKRLPRTTIVLMLTVFSDPTGRLSVSPDLVPQITSAAAAPVYTLYDASVGRGVVGGHTDSLEAVGTEIADLTLEILSGKHPSSLPPRATTGNADRVDWRQLKRWKLSEERLSADTEVRFREHTIWEQYRWHIAAIIAILLAQGSAITWLQLERHRRQRAETDLRQRLLEVIHLNRSAVTGALSASVAHELNQPLGAIQSYAEAASLYLKAEPPNLGRIEEILGNIRRDDKRAADIISHLRGLLKKQDHDNWQEFDLNEAVRDALRVVGPEASKRGVQLKTFQADASLPVRGDPIHMQQVILNLAMNGMDAMQSCSPGQGRMSIETVMTEGNIIEVSVADSGTGIPANKIDEIFDPFFTTKGHGTGLGLSIARTIVETYGGKLWAENRPSGGAAFRFTLPLARVSVA